MITIKEARNNYGRTGGKYWYLSKHGIGPGTLPKDVNVLNTIEDGMDTYILVDGVLTTEELREYDLKEKVPPEIDAIYDSMGAPSKFDICTEELSNIIKFDLSKEERKKLIRNYVNYFNITNYREINDFTIYTAMPRLLLQGVDFCNINEFPAIKEYIETIDWD